MTGPVTLRVLQLTGPAPRTPLDNAFAEIMNRMCASNVFIKIHSIAGVYVRERIQGGYGNLQRMESYGVSLKSYTTTAFPKGKGLWPQTAKDNARAKRSAVSSPPNAAPNQPPPPDPLDACTHATHATRPQIMQCVAHKQERLQCKRSST